MPSQDDWWVNYDNIILLVHHLATHVGYTAEEIADVVEKPWHFTTEFQEALIEHAIETEGTSKETEEIVE